MHTILRALCVVALAALTAANVVQSLAYANTSQYLRNTNTSLVAVPFGGPNNVKFSEPSLVQTADSEFDANNIASDESWNKYKAKGVWYGCLLDMDIETAGKNLRDERTPPSAESVWQGDLANDIRNWGWHEATYEPAVHCDFRDAPDIGAKNKIGTALSSLGLSLLPAGAGGDNECYSIEHFDETLEHEDDDEDEDEDDEGVPIEEQWYTVNGHEFPCTGAYYRFAVNKRGGAIFAQNLLKPEHAALENFGAQVPDDQLPHLSRASDIMWGYWFRNNPNPNNLHNYFVNHIRNDETLPLIARILKNYGMTKLPFWPGLELEMDDEGAEAILGSPMGSTIAHFLLQHKQVLGIKNFESIVIFRDNVPADSPGEQAPDTQLLFRIIDVPPDEVDDSDTEMPDVSATKLKRALEYLGPKNIVREHKVVIRLESD